MNDELINRFREVVNGNNGFVYKSYSNVDGKNHWNLVCSCMDWITLVARFHMAPFEWSSDINVKAVQVYSYIATTGIIVEAIQQLHRVFFKTKNGPFQGDRRHFSTSPTHQDDDRYFMQLRATFGAHPVRLDDDNGQWFASWPYDHYLESNFDIQVKLYSKDVGGKDVSFGLNLTELESFLDSRYAHLESIITEIQSQYESFCSRLSHVHMITSVKNVDDIAILRTESKKRLDSEYYNSRLDEIGILLGATTGISELLAEESAYKAELLVLANEIRSNLQAMIFTDLECDKVIDLPYPFEGGMGYAIGKLYNFDFDRHQEPLFSTHIAVLNDFCNGKYHFDMSDSPETVRLKLKLMLYWKKNFA